MNGLRPTTVLLCAVIVLGAQPSAAQSVAAAQPQTDILAAHILGTSEYTSVEATMEIHGARGTQTRRIEVYIHRPPRGGSEILAQIVWPAFLTNMKFLVHSDDAGNQERWMKTSRGVRRLSNANFQDSVFNSDFTVEDFSYLDEADYVFSYGAPEQGLDVVEAEIRDADSTVRTKVFRIDPEARLIREIDYLDSAGRVVRRYRTISTQHVGGLEYPALVEMTDLAAGTKTAIRIEAIDIDGAIPARMFNRAGL